jgi:hypothetical protein
MSAVMAKQVDEEVRTHFTDIGCIMEDGSSVALIWDASDLISLPDRYERLVAAYNQIGAALEKIKAAIEGG